jgi:hypothetical protein
MRHTATEIAREPIGRPSRHVGSPSKTQVQADHFSNDSHVLIGQPPQVPLQAQLADGRDLIGHRFPALAIHFDIGLATWLETGTT